MALHARPGGQPSDLNPHTGMWGAVSAVIGDQVEISIDEFDGGEHAFGPVPFQPPTAEPAVGDIAFLHFDIRHRPAYAVIFA
jgi:hypothetical protein